MKKYCHARLDKNGVVTYYHSHQQQVQVSEYNDFDYAMFVLIDAGYKLVQLSDRVMWFVR